MRMRVRRVGVLALALASSGIQVAPDIPGVIDIGHRKQLFIDDYGVESMEPRVYRLMNQPQKYHNNPIRPATNHAPSRLSRFRVTLAEYQQSKA